MVGVGEEPAASSPRAGRLRTVWLVAAAVEELDLLLVWRTISRRVRRRGDRLERQTDRVT
ncbi:MAG TPA: hypothetical protein VGP03_11235 [Pseudonocardiaceae bacterium]|nr:hypothetical protein [Pseudonocardiaceae bacterium]